MRWNDITKKLAPINKGVFIFKKNKTDIRHAKLCIYDPKISKLNDCNFTKGDIYWESRMHEDEHWLSIETYPYWLTNKELVKLISEKEEKLNRFELLDL